MQARRRRPRVRVTGLGVLVCMTVAAACSSDDADADRSHPSPGSHASSSQAPSGVSSAPESSPTSPQPRPSPSGSLEPPPVTLAFAGDIHFEGVLRDRLDNPPTALAGAPDALASADVTVANLETSIGTGGRPEPGKRYTFQAPPSALTALAAAGIDVATMANNHALDYGRAQLAETFDAIESAIGHDPPLAVVGVGRNADHAFRPARIDVDGTVVATIGATVADDDPTADPTGLWAATDESPGTADAINPSRLLAAVGEADRSSDVVVTYLHWGIQGDRCPSSSQQELAAAVINAGADIVVGSHAHRLQGDGHLGDGYVAYGLGNFAWYTQSTQASSTTGVLTLTVQPDATREDTHADVTSAEWSPARIGSDGLPTPMSGAEVAEFDATIADLRECAGLVS